MSFDAFVTGAVVRYPFLWSHEAKLGETEGRKANRPVTVGFRLSRPGGKDVLLLFPVTSKEPAGDRVAVEIPETEKRRGGLVPDARLWLILDEFNEDVIGESYYLEAVPPIGHLSRAFVLPLLKRFIASRDAAVGVRRNR